MDGYMLLAYILAGAGVFLIMCFGVVLIMIAVDFIRNSYVEVREVNLFSEEEVKEDDPFREDEIAEGN